MSSAVTKIRNEVRHLPLGDRMRLVKDLEDDLDSDAPELEAAWDIEEQKRSDEVMKGDVKLMSFDDLTSRLDKVRAKHTPA